MKEEDVLNLIVEDKWMMEIIKLVDSMRLQDCYVAGGFVRNKIWDYLHSYKNRTPLNDIDVAYFDKNYLSKDRDIEIEIELSKINDTLKWSVKNQARMHIRNNHIPYKSATEAISHWTETATCIGVRLNSDRKLELIYPHGLDDLIKLIVRPTIGTDLSFYRQRVEKKYWHILWPKLIIMEYEK